MFSETLERVGDQIVNFLAFCATDDVVTSLGKIFARIVPSTVEFIAIADRNGVFESIACDFYS